MPPRVYVLEREQVVPVAPADAFEFFAEAANLEEITPPWLHFRIDSPEPIEMGAGTLIPYRLRLHGVPLRWLTRIVAWEPGRHFADLQVSGPYRSWHHSHTFLPHRRGTLMKDRVLYELPFGPLGRLARTVLVRRDLERIFDFRAAEIAMRLARR